MNAVEGSKSDVKVSDITSSATHAHTIDTLGFGYASIDVAFEPVAAAGTNSAVANVLTLEHGDTTGSYAAITGFVAGTDYTLPTPSSTSATTVVRLNVNLEGRKRYLKVSVTPKADGAIGTAARLSIGDVAPVAATAAGVNVFVSG